MAFIFTKLPSSLNLLNAYNNNIIEFTNDEGTAIFCNVSVGPDEYRISPNPNGVFRFNFKDAFKTLLNKDNFEDTATLPLNAGDPNTIIEEDTVNAYASASVHLVITFSEGFTRQSLKVFKVLRSVENIKRISKRIINISTNDLFFLTPFEDVSDRVIKLTYFFGYPFDISYYINADETRKVSLLSGYLDPTVNVDFKKSVGRFIISNVMTEITAHLPIKTGLNILKVSPVVPNPSEDFYIHLTKKVECRGVYVKYLNQYGKWNYWLFNQEDKTELRTRGLKEIFNDFDDLEDNQSPILQTGKRSSERIRAHSRGVTQDEMLTLKGLFEAAKVYLWTGEAAGFLTAFSLNDFVEVKLNDGSFIIDDYKKKTFNVNCVFELPERNTLKIW